MEIKTTERLEVLLAHWINHNNEHAAEYERWAQRAQDEGLDDISAAIRTAATTTAQSNDSLRKALNLLDRSS
ncbi:MAG: hypothetical protein JXD19_10200 [Deltaproteobacteria bacterium]|nr:hypothetical protein [Deltaproteobacteria bacterium]